MGYGMEIYLNLDFSTGKHTENLFFLFQFFSSTIPRKLQAHLDTKRLFPIHPATPFPFPQQIPRFPSLLEVPGTVFFLLFFRLQQIQFLKTHSNPKKVVHLIRQCHSHRQLFSVVFLPLSFLVFSSEN